MAQLGRKSQTLKALWMTTQAVCRSIRFVFLAWS